MNLNLMFGTSQFTSSAVGELNAAHSSYVTSPFDKPFGPISPVKVLFLHLIMSSAPRSVDFSVDTPPVPFTFKNSETSTNSNLPVVPFSFAQLRSSNFLPLPAFSKQTKKTGVMADADADANAPTANIATT